MIWPAPSPPGHIAVCRVQTGGRGRFNRKWIGEEGGLWASFTVPLSAPEDTAADVHWGHLPLVAGLALFNMLRGMGLDSVRLRWPNDLLAGKSKLAGILVERPAENMAVIGIGINVSMMYPPSPGKSRTLRQGWRILFGTALPCTPSWLPWAVI